MLNYGGTMYDSHVPVYRPEALDKQIEAAASKFLDDNLKVRLWRVSSTAFFPVSL